MARATDIKFMRRTLQLAQKGSGFVSSNPMVGAVIVKNGKVIGEGFHQRFGEAHAEINAIESASQPVRGATLYCNLESCCHRNKKTPPCIPRIIREGIKRVVIASLDPNPEVNGKGVEFLRNAGIVVETGIMQEESDELNRFFFKYITTMLPYVTLKVAQSIDGKITEKIGEQTWLSAKASQLLVHKWRSAYDAVLIGANTVKIDNPQLTVRYVAGRNPIRVVLDGNLTLNAKYRLFHADYSSKTIVISQGNQDKKRIKRYKGLNCEVISIPGGSNNRIPIKDILRVLVQKNITSILVEGGQQIFSQFISQECVDEIAVFIAPKILGRGLSTFDLENTDMGRDFKLIRYEECGADVLLTYRI